MEADSIIYYCIGLFLNKAVYDPENWMDGSGKKG